MAWVIAKDRRMALLREQSAKAGRQADASTADASTAGSSMWTAAASSADASTADLQADVHRADSPMAAPPVAPTADTTPPWKLSPVAPAADNADTTPPWKRHGFPPLPPPPPPPADTADTADPPADSLITSRQPGRRVTIDAQCEAPGCDQNRESIQCLLCAVHCTWPPGCAWPANVSGLCTVHWNKLHRCQFADYWCHHPSKQNEPFCSKHFCKKHCADSDCPAHGADAPVPLLKSRNRTPGLRAIWKHHKK